MQLQQDPRQEPLIEQLRALSLSKESEQLELMISLAGRDVPAFSRNFFNPGHFTASAFVLCPRGEQLLLINHTKLQMWLQPGGHIEVSDSDPVAAALREVEEETALREFDLQSPLFDIDVHQIPAWGETPAHLHHDLRVLLQAKSMAVVGGSDVSDARWFPLEELASSEGSLRSGVGTDESVRRVARTLLSRA